MRVRVDSFEAWEIGEPFLRVTKEAWRREIRDITKILFSYACPRLPQSFKDTKSAEPLTIEVDFGDHADSTKLTFSLTEIIREDLRFALNPDDPGELEVRGLLHVADGLDALSAKIRRAVAGAEKRAAKKR